MVDIDKLTALLSKEEQAFAASPDQWHRSFRAAKPRTEKTFFYLCRKLALNNNERIQSDEEDEPIRSTWTGQGIPLGTDPNPVAHFSRLWTQSISGQEKSFQPYFREVLARQAVNNDDKRPYYIQIHPDYAGLITGHFQGQQTAVLASAQSANQDPHPMHSTKDAPIGKSQEPLNRIFYGPPGTGKTYELQRILDRDYTGNDGIKRYRFVTFHQSYGYEEFVEGLRPVLIAPLIAPGAGLAEDVQDEECEAATAADVADTESPRAQQDDDAGSVGYRIEKGAFWHLCDAARSDPEHRYAMLIDEINRGNLSRIFGELITLIETDKREGMPNALAVSLAYSREEFSVPKNVDIIATMNTADRSLALVDTALRRRFDFIEFKPDTSAGGFLEGRAIQVGTERIDIRRMLDTINLRIEALYDRDHRIGHAYFREIHPNAADNFQHLSQAFQSKVIPLLQEYFFEDWRKIQLVLGDNQKQSDKYRFIKVIDQDGDLQALFGPDHGLDPYGNSVRARYELNTMAFDEPLSYIQIYQS